MNAALAAGKHPLLTPGIYRITEPVRVTRADTVVMGIGYANLMPTNGTAAITVADVNGVTVTGPLLNAGPKVSPVLLEVGPAGSKADHEKNPTAVFDLFCRIGGAAAGKARPSAVINSNNVIGDNVWLWGADHGKGPPGTRTPTPTAGSSTATT